MSASLDTVNGSTERTGWAQPHGRKQVTATDRFGHTWTFNIRLLAVGLSGGQSAVDSPPTLSWHVEEGGEGGETTEGDQNKNGWLVKKKRKKERRHSLWPKEV